MMGRSVRVARIAGIPIGISPWWLAIVAFFTWTLGSNYFPEAVPGISHALAYALGFASVLLLFLSILLHEIGHAVVARRNGVEVEEIDLWLLGGVARMRGEARDPGAELRYAIAGPAVTAIIAACFGVVVLLLPASTPESARVFLEYQLLINVFLLVFNLLPAFPLDGGRVFRAILWARMNDMQRATNVAARVGNAFGYALAAIGVVLLLGGEAYNGVWLVFIGWFVATAARQQAAGAEIRSVFAGEHASDLMSSQVVVIPGELSLEDATNDYFGRYPYTAFPVVDADGRAIGLLTLEAAKAALAAPGPAGSARAAEVADRDPALRVQPGADVGALLEDPAFSRVGRAVVVDPAGRPTGVVSITDVQRAIRSAQMRAAGRSGQPVG
jgi:Zn-dependent protease